MTPMSQRKAIAVFAVFAGAYFLSALVRAITATLAPALVQEFSLNAGDLGLLAGGYFLGFALTQLPLGAWLDGHGPRKVVLGFLSVAVLGCLAFSLATGFATLLAARVLCGIGLSACLMAPLAGYRMWYAPANQLRANSWMLMVGSLGMVASTLPVQWLLPVVGWRLIFVGLAVLLCAAMLLISWQIPAKTSTHTGESDPLPTPELHARGSASPSAGYGQIWQNPYFRRLTPLGFFNFGGLVAMQTLWAAPWMVNVAGHTPMQAATGLFWVNMAMLLAFWLWGLANPWLASAGFSANRLITLGMPLSLVALAFLVCAGDAWSQHSALMWVVFCVGSTFAALAQPALGMAVAAHMAGRVLAAYNLVIFCGIFTVQWGIGLLIDGLHAAGFTLKHAYQGAFGVFGLCCCGSYLFFLWQSRHNQEQQAL